MRYFVSIASNVVRKPGRTRLTVSCMLTCLVLATSSSIQSWVPTGHKWIGSGIPVTMILNLGSSWNSVASEALGAWSSAGSQFSFGSTTSSSSQTPSCSQPEIDNRNVVVWRSTLCGGNWNTALAVAVTWHRNGVSVDSDVIFDSNRQWSAYSGNLVPGRDDLRRVAIHEFGHVLGLDHPDEHGQIQVAIMNSRVSDIDTLQADDIAGVIGIYGR